MFARELWRACRQRVSHPRSSYALLAYPLLAGHSRRAGVQSGHRPYQIRSVRSTTFPAERLERMNELSGVVLSRWKSPALNNLVHSKFDMKFAQVQLKY
jgi:hypothetical protein